MVEEAKETAKIEGTRIIDQAKNEIAREVSQAKEVLRTQLSTLAIAGAEKILKRNLDDAAQNGLLDELVAEI